MSSLDTMINRSRAAIDAETTGLPSAEQQHLDRLLARQAERDQAVAAHATAETEHAEELGILGRELDDARRTLATLVTAAVAALMGARDTAADYDRRLAEQATRLRTLGLPAAYAEGSDAAHRFHTGGSSDTAVGLGGPRLLLDGQPWHAVHVDDVVNHVMVAATGRPVGVVPPRVQHLRELLDVDAVRRDRRGRHR